MHFLKRSMLAGMLVALLSILLTTPVAGVAALTCGAWHIVKSPNGPGENNLNGVAAVSANNVWAVGTMNANTQSGSQTLIEHWNGTNWHIVKSPNVQTYNFLYGVAAVSANNIWAVGNDIESSSPQTLIEHWDGTSWSIVASPNLGYLTAVGATSATDVWAVGYYNENKSLIEHWDGTSWKVVKSPNVGTSYNQLFSVSVVAANDVWAVGFHADSFLGTWQTFTLHWDGTSWKVVKSPNPGSSVNVLNGVTVASSTDVWAVGYSSFSHDTGLGQALIEHWNGTNWRVVKSPTVQTNDFLYGVAAVSAHNVWAVGYSNLNGPSNSQTLIEHWNGMNWKAVKSPNTNSLVGIAVASASNVWAVGSTSGQTLTEFYC